MRPDADCEGMRMSNIVPQRKGRNHVVWGRLEDQHRVCDPAFGITTVWTVSGPIFYADKRSTRSARLKARLTLRTVTR